MRSAATCSRPRSPTPPRSPRTCSSRAGADNGWQPSPTDRTQIAYGADSRIQSLLAVADASGRPGLRRLAGVAATCYFGNNAAGAVVYDAATGRTFDGVSSDGVVNQNSGAESTIHGLLSMIALEGAPDAARWSQVAAVAEREDLAGRRGGGRRPVGRRVDRDARSRHGPARARGAAAGT